MLQKNIMAVLVLLSVAPGAVLEASGTAGKTVNKDTVV